MQLPIIYDIQRYSIHDGSGIRTTVFFKGCPLRCGWCHNPESQHFAPELLFNPEKCTGCGGCARVCPRGAVTMADGAAVTDRKICTACGECTDACLAGAREAAGRTYTLEELMREVEKDEMFYEQSGGGVTLSGGEVMAQEPFEYIEELMRRLHGSGFSVNIDTCGFAPYERFARILPYTDTFLYDIKEMDAAAHRHFTGEGNELILSNLRRLSGAGARINLRLPLIGGVNAKDAHIRAVIGFLRGGVHVTQINLLPYHDMGRSKYGRLGRPYDTGRFLSVPPDEDMNRFAELLRQSGFSKVILGG